MFSAVALAMAFVAGSASTKIFRLIINSHEY